MDPIQSRHSFYSLAASSQKSSGQNPSHSSAQTVSLPRPLFGQRGQTDPTLKNALPGIAYKAAFLANSFPSAGIRFGNTSDSDNKTPSANKTSGGIILPTAAEIDCVKNLSTDGPSAGVTITTAIVRELTGINAGKDVVMTGALDSQSRVLPIGEGLKEKVDAAYRAGIKRVLLPEESQKDIEKVPEYQRNAVELVIIENIRDPAV
jgi:hypothetical protein